MHYRPLSPDPKYNFITQGTILSPIPFEKFFNDNFMILPNFIQREKILKEVQYVDDPSVYLKDVVDLRVDPDGNANMQLKEVNDFATYKQKVWSFQEEVRFVLFILPTIPIPPDGFSNKRYLRELPSYIMTSIIKGNGPNLKEFYIDIDPNVLENIVVTLGPLCNEGDEVVVDSLLKKYTTNGVMKKSELAGTIRKTGK
jgi:hypothetical protein